MAAAAIFEKSKNHDISVAVGAISTKSGTLNPHWCSSSFLNVPTVKKWNFYNPRWRRPPSWKINKSQYLGCVLADFNEIWRGDVVWPSWPPSWKIEKSPYFSRGWTDFDENWHDDAVRPSRPLRPLKILSDFDEIWHSNAVRHSWRVRPLKIWNF